MLLIARQEAFTRSLTRQPLTPEKRAHRTSGLIIRLRNHFTQSSASNYNEQLHLSGSLATILR